MKVVTKDKNGKLVVVDDSSYEDVRMLRSNRPAGTSRKQATKQSFGGTLADSATKAAGVALNPIGNAWDSVKGYLPDSVSETVDDFGHGALKGATFGLNTRGSGAIEAVKGAIQKGSLSSLKDDYNRGRYESEQDQIMRQQRSPWASGLGEVAGSLVVPVGGAGLGLKAASALKGGAALGRVGQLAAGGAGAGLVSGLLTGAGQTQDLTDVPQAAQDIATGGAFGAAGGALLGTLAAPISNATRGLRAKIGSRVGRALEGKSPVGPEAADAAKFAAKRSAYTAISEDAKRQVLDTLQTGGVTPKMAERKMAEMRAQGANPILADTSRATQGELKALQDRGTRGVEDIAENLDTRANRRGGRLRKFIGDITGVDSRETASELKHAMREVRRTQGTHDYRVGGPIDSPAVTTPELQQIAANFSPVDNMPEDNLEGIMNTAYKTIKAHPKYPHPFIQVPDPTVPTGVKNVPSMRMWDQVLRGYRERIGNLYKDGKGTMADALKAQMGDLKDKLVAVNPEYENILSYHSRELAKDAALDVSTHFGDKIFTKPRQVYEKIMTGHTPEEIQVIRRGLLDHIFDKTGSTRALPAKIKNALTDPNQPEAKQLWELILGGQDKTDAMLKWIKTEVPGQATEAVTGRNSITSFARAAMEESERKEQSALGYAGRAVLGAATSNPAMFAANTATLTQRLADKLSAGTKQATRTRVLRELVKERKSGDILKMARNLRKAELTRAAARKIGVTRVGRYGGLKGAQYASPGIGDGYD